MPELSIRFTSDEKVEDSPISVSLFRPDKGTLTKPPRPLRRRWTTFNSATYAGTWKSFHLADRPRITSAPSGIEVGLEDWGRALARASSSARMLPRSGSNLWTRRTKASCLTIDATDPRVLRLRGNCWPTTVGHSSRAASACGGALQQATTGRTQSF